MKKLILLSLVCCIACQAQTARDSFLESLDRFAREHEQIRPEDIYIQARVAFEHSPEEVRKKVDSWLDSLPPATKAEGYTPVGEFGKAATREQADSALKDRPAAGRLYMQGFTPEDVIWLAISQVDSLGLRKERQSYQMARVYVRPRTELASRSESEARLVIYDFDFIIELTVVRTSVGVLCPTVFKVLKREPIQSTTDNSGASPLRV